MLHRFRLFSVFFAAFFVLAACDSGSNETASQDSSIIEHTEISLTEESTDDQTLAETNESTETASEEEVSEVLTREVEVVEAAEEEAKELAEEPTEETIDPVTKMAVERVAEVTGLDGESHTFLFDEADGYMEVEVREKQEEGSSPMVGKYRYVYDTAEILSMDYLTGEFVPYENAE